MKQGDELTALFVGDLTFNEPQFTPQSLKLELMYRMKEYEFANDTSVHNQQLATVISFTR